jgi:hypothetical protein
MRIADPQDEAEIRQQRPPMNPDETQVTSLDRSNMEL